MTTPTLPPGSPDRRDAAVAIESAVSRLLVVGTYLGIGLILVGVGGMLATGVAPLDAPLPPFSLAEIPAQMLALDPVGFLWAGLVAFLLLPVGRVFVAGFGFLAARERDLALVSLLVILVIGLSIAAAQVVQG